MKHVLPALILFLCYGISYSQSAVFNPADPIINYDSTQPAGSAAHPIVPYNNQIVKWVRTPKTAGYPTGTPAITWNTSNYKCYMVNNLPFRMRYPNGYVPGANDGKKFPIVIFWHGGGECEGYYSLDNNVYTYHAYGNGVWDNEYQLYQGAQALETKTATDQDAFILFPQSPIIGWDGGQFAAMNVAIDEIIKNCKGDPDRVISMGLSVGGLASIQYALAYPQRVASIIASSGIQVGNLANSMGPAIHIPLWFGDGGQDTSPDSATVQVFENGYNASGGIMLRSYLPLQSHVMWDYQWAEEPSFDSAWSTAHKANPLVYNNNRFFCPGATNISATMGITPGYYAYRWDKDGVIIPGANSSDYTATAFGTYRCSFMRTSTSAWSDWSLSPAKIVAVCPPVTGNGTGLAATYFNSNNLTNPVVSRLDPSMNFYIENGASPAPGIATNTNYSVRWTGKIQAKFTEPYTIYTFSDDGVRMWINGQLLIDNWTTHGGTENSATISMVAGQQYDIKIEYYNNYNYQNVYNSINSYVTGIFSLRWSSPSTVKTMVPKTQLYPTSDSAAPPACVTNTSPANGSTIGTPTTATLTWPSAATATSYDVYLWTGATVPTTPTANTTALSYSASGLTASTTYNWYIAPRNATGVATNCVSSNKTTFTTAATAATVSNAGSDVTIVLPTSSVTLDGSASTGNIVQYYWFQAQGPVQSVIGDNFAAVTTATGLTTAGTYVFGLQVKDNNGTPAYSYKTVTVKAAGTRVATFAADTVTTAGFTTTTLRTATSLPALSSTLPGLGSGLTGLSSTVSPNPVASGQMARLVINSNKAGTATVAVVNINGNIVAMQRVNLVAGINTAMVSTYGLAQGLHAIHITGGDKPLIVKLVVE